MEYILKATKEDIAKSISKQGWTFGEDALKEADYILKHCPKELYPNIDEMVEGRPISDIEVKLMIQGKLKNVSVNEIKKAFYDVPLICNIIMAISMKNNNENGFNWLGSICEIIQKGKRLNYER